MTRNAVLTRSGVWRMLERRVGGSAVSCPRGRCAACSRVSGWLAWPVSGGVRVGAPAPMRGVPAVSRTEPVGWRGGAAPLILIEPHPAVALLKRSSWAHHTHKSAGDVGCRPRALAAR